MSGAPSLTDGTVTLRAHRDDDVAALVEQGTDPDSVRWTTVPTPYTRADAYRFVREVMPGGWASGRRGFAIETGGGYAGTVELRDEGDGRSEIAFISHPGARGSGVMERACRLVLDWGFGSQGVRTVVWRAHVGNWASRRLAWRLGFSLDGTVREYLVHRGGLLVDAWTGTLLATDDRRPRGLWLDAPPLGDGVVRLRAVRSGDRDRVVEAAGDERTQRWLGRMPAPYTSVEAATWLEQITEEAATGRTVTWAVTGEDDVLSGVVNLFDLDPGNSAEIGFWAHPDARGRGLTTRACVLALRHGFTAFDLVRVQGHAALGNAASRHVLEASGLREAGVARLGTFVRPEGRVDAMKYDVLVEEWRASRHSVAGVISG